MITVTCAICEKDKKILIARRAADQKLAGKWEFPGGKVEDGESPEECLKRELEEEFGIQAEVGSLSHQISITTIISPLSLWLSELNIFQGNLH